MRSDSKISLVTGGAGFIGSHLVERLLHDRWCVKVLDNFSSGCKENLSHLSCNPCVKLMKGDIKNPETMLSAVEGVNVVFHFAANPEVRLSTTHPRIHFEENVVGTFNLLEAIRQRRDNVSLVFASSSSVYGEPDKNPVSEERPLRPVSVYGASKVACESLIRTYASLYGIRSIVLRYANVVGPRLRHGVVYDFLVKLLNKPRELEILGDGTQVRSYLHVDDAISATLTAYEAVDSRFGAYNIGNDDFLTVQEVAEIVVKVMNLNRVNYTYRPVLHGVGWLGDVKKTVLNVSRIKSLGWKPTRSSKESIELAAKSLLELGQRFS